MKTKCLLYCTKGKPYIYKEYTEKELINEDIKWLNGKIGAECEVECEEICHEAISNGVGVDHHYMLEDGTYIYKESCLKPFEMNNYLKGKNGSALHISNLKVFDEPLKLNELEYAYEIDYAENMRCDSCTSSCKCENCYYHYNMRDLIKAPENMCWCWYKGEKYCLISIRPEWYCKIANGEKTIEVRKKILKGMM